MCGIFVTTPPSEEFSLRAMSVLKNRGPDEQKMETLPFASIAVARLSITDPEKGKQPIYSPTGNSCLIFNGALYNNEELREVFSGDYEFRSRNDGEVILALYERYGIEFASHLEGMFAIIIIDVKRKKIILSRDAIGIKPLYWVYTEDRIIAASSIRAIPEEFYSDVKDFPAGVTWSSDKTIARIKPRTGFTHRDFLTHLRISVRRHIPQEVPWACMLSGGLDSSLLAALAAEVSEKPVRCYTIGTDDSSDVRAARHLAESYHFEHKVIQVTRPEVLSATRETIEATATYDPLTVMSGVGTLLLAKRVAKEGIKVLISGEGADEMFAGYDEYQGLSPDSLNDHLIHDQDHLGVTECLRLDRCTMAYSIEARVPFLTPSLVSQSRLIAAEEKIVRHGRTTISKYHLREVASSVLPSFISYREKNPFYRGSGIGGILMEEARRIYPSLPSQTQEETKLFRIGTHPASWFFTIWKDLYPNLASDLDSLMARGITRKIHPWREEV